MRRLPERRRRKVPLIVDEDCGIPVSLIETYQPDHEGGLLGQADSAALILSMSEYGKPQPYDEVYEYSQATRPQHTQDYPAFAQQTYPQEYAGIQAQVPSGLQHSANLSVLPTVQYGTHDSSYYTQPHAAYPPFIGSTSRQLPIVQSYTPAQGQFGSKVTVYFRSVYNLETPPATILIMFGSKRCDSVLSKTAHQDQQFHYSLSAEAPALETTGSLSPQIPLHLMFESDQSVTWESPSLEFGHFTYSDVSSSYDAYSPPQAASRKRKLSSETADRRSPMKRSSTIALPTQTREPSQSYSAQPQAATPASPFNKPSLMESYAYNKRFSGQEYQQGYNTGIQPLQPQHRYMTSPASSAAQPIKMRRSLYSGYGGGLPLSDRSPSIPSASSVGKSQLLPSPASVTNPPLIRTSTIQQSPTTPGPSIAPAQVFNPYAIYPSNAKAMLKIEGSLESMAEDWSTGEWEAKRRLVQFRRSQSGSVITATFEPVTLEDRVPNSICVSCIWWEEKQQTFVTSVDTIQLLESLVAVRFTVEEKNRIRRNLEGFRPATVSKTKPESEEFFKLIMGFPNPKPRNIEKDVKVFPWRVLGIALKKIIGKYSASYSSTAGPMHTPTIATYTAGRPPDAGIDQRAAASPRSATSSATSTAYATTMTSTYAPHPPMSTLLGSSAVTPGLRLAVPSSASGPVTSWHQPSASYANDPTGTGRSSWDFGQYLEPSPGTALPGSSQALQYPARIPSITQPAAFEQTKFVPLQDSEEYGQRTSRA